MKVFGVIYLIINMFNGKKYVGQTTKNVEERFKYHARNKRSLIGKAIRKYGRKNFRYGVIVTCSSKAEMNEREKFFIAVLKTKSPTGYNRTDGGDGAAGCVDSDETRARKSKSHLGNKNALGYRHTAESLVIMSERHGGENHHFFGKHLTDEHCARIGAGNRQETPFKNLCNAMVEQGLTYKSLAKRLGLSLSSFSMKMLGKRHFTAKDIGKLVAIFNLPAEYLMARVDGLPAIIQKQRKTPLKNLATEMDKRQLTCKKLGELMGLLQSTIEAKVAGRNRFKLEEIAKLVAILNLPAEYLMARADAPQKI